MSKRPGAITFKANPMTLVGNELQVGDAAPDFNLTANDLSQKTLADFAGKTIVLSAVPSLDTGICDVETRTFNEKAAGLGDDVVVLTVSLDLPFAQKRWCGAHNIDRVVTLSDYKTHDFATNYGILIEELTLLARCIFVIKDARITYIQLVPEVAEEPDYEAVLAAAE